MHYSDSRSKTTIFIEQLIENLFKKGLPFFWESFKQFYVTEWYEAIFA